MLSSCLVYHGPQSIWEIKIITTFFDILCFWFICETQDPWSPYIPLYGESIFVYCLLTESQRSQNILQSKIGKANVLGIGKMSVSYFFYMLCIFTTMIKSLFLHVVPHIVLNRPSWGLHSQSAFIFIESYNYTAKIFIKILVEILYVARKKLFQKEAE